MLETTSLGAAYAAGIGVGFWTPEWVLRDITAESKGVSVIEPQADREDILKRYQKWQKAVQKSIGLADLAN